MKPIKLLIANRQGESFYYVTQIEPYKVSGSKLIHGAWIVTRRLSDRAGYTMDYGIEAARGIKLFDKPIRANTLKAEQAFQALAQEIIRGINNQSVVNESLTTENQEILDLAAWAEEVAIEEAATAALTYSAGVKA